MAWKKHIPVALLLVAVLLLGFSLSSSSFETHVRSAQHIFATAVVGMSASIPPNPYNSLAMQLEQKEEELAKREQRLAALEVSADRDGGNPFALYAFGISILLFVLVGLNFYMDWRRGRREQKGDEGGGLSINLK